MCWIVKSARSVRRLFWSLTHFSLIYQIRRSWQHNCNGDITAVVFSKDRAMQLHALLSSFFDTKIGECGIVVIYKSTTEAHKKAYEEVAGIFRNQVGFIEQDAYPSFRSCLKHTVSRLPNGKVFFLVDDIVFTEEVDYRFLAAQDLSNTIFSLRMGKHLDYSYTVSLDQPLPESLLTKDGYLVWKWSEGKLDWGYPLSVDGHVFSIAEVLLWITHLKFSSPSSFEGSLQKLSPVYSKKFGMSFMKARLVNIPANKVQNEVNNLHGDVHQDDLLQQWFDGLAIDHTKFRGWINHSVHQEADFHLIKRECE